MLEIKQIVSFSLRKGTLAKMEEQLRNSNSHRNKSHLVECAIEEYLREHE